MAQDSATRVGATTPQETALLARQAQPSRAETASFITASEVDAVGQSETIHSVQQNFGFGPDKSRAFAIDARRWLMLPLLLCNVRDQLHDIVDILLHPLNFPTRKTKFSV